MRIPREVVRQREIEVWELRQRFWSQERIAEEVGISQPAVSKILRRLDQRYLSELKDGVEAKKIEQLSQLEYIASQAVDAWEASKEPRRTVTAAKRGTGEGAGSVQTQQQTDQNGDPRFLAEARAALADQRKILGIDAPIRQEHTAKVETEITINDDAIIRKLFPELANPGTDEPS